MSTELTAACVMLGLIFISSCHGQVRYSCPSKNCSIRRNSQGQNVFDCSSASCVIFPFNVSLSLDADIINLSNNSINEIPKLNQSRVTELNLANNNIHQLGENIFEECTNLITLKLGGNHISDLPSGPFDHMPHLQHLYLDHNEIELINDSFVFFENEALKTLDLQHNQIAFIDKDSAYDFTHIDTIILSHNLLQEIHEETFGFLAFMESLYLDNNLLVRLHADVFASQGKLALLDLRHNSLTELPSTIFTSLSSLQILHLSHNPLSLFQQGLFSDRSVLEEIDLDFTNFAETCPGSFPKSLTNVSLSHNDRLSKIVNGTFTDLKQLKKVVIQNNFRLDVIEPGAFSGRNTSVEHLMLANNALTTLSENLLSWKEVKSLELSGNRWDCTCHLEWMLTTLSKEILEEIRCSTPLALKGKKLSAMTSSDLSCDFMVVHRYEAATALSVVVSMVFASVAICLTYRYRRSILSCNTRSTTKYQTLYEVDADDDDEVMSVTFNKMSVSNGRVGSRLARNGSSVPAPTPV